LVAIALERLGPVAVVVHAIAPVIVAHQCARRGEFGDAPGQAGEEMPDLPELVPAELLRLDERLQEVHRQPGMLFRQRAPHADDVHDREHLRAPEIILLYRAEVREEARDVWRAAQKAGRRARADHAIELAGLEHRGQRLFLRDRLEVYFRRQLERRTLLAAGILDAAAAPAHIAHVHAVLVVQDAADPDVRGDLVFRQAERRDLQVLPPPDAAIGADVDAGVPEQTGNKGGDRDIVILAARDLQRVA